MNRGRILKVGRAFLFLACFLALIATPAAADSTHKYMFTVNMPKDSSPQPTAVDSEGNLYVFNEGPNTVSKYHIDVATETLKPVNFSALGTNTMDGKGFGEDCPATPADCDRVPSNGFLDEELFNLRGSITIDNSNGPAHGYIYVVNPGGGPESPLDSNHLGAVEVFDSTGRFRGELDKSGDGPRKSGPGGGYVNVDNQGHIFLFWPNLPGVIDELVPIDGNPAHNTLRGQIVANLPCTGFPASEAIGSNPYSYGQGCGNEWQAYGYSEYTTVRQGRNSTHWISFPPDDPLFQEEGGEFEYITMDPSNGDVYLTDRDTGAIRQWSADNEPIGPLFGPPYTAEREPSGFGAFWKLAVDSSSGPDRGTIYGQGNANHYDSIAVFSPPVPLPDITYKAPVVGHTTAHLSATVDLAGGPEVTSCRMEWGLGKPVPCNEPTPYAGTQVVSADLSKLTVERLIGYRFVVETANGVKQGRSQSFRTAAVLGLTTDPATGVTPSTATLNGSLNPDNLATKYHFEYGSTTNYNVSTPTRDAAPGGAIAALPGEDLSGLQPGRLYHYRLIASNGLGTTKGEDRTLLIPRSPQISAVRAAEVTETSAVLHAKINTVGFDGSYHFEYGSSVGYGAVTPTVALTASGDPQDAEAQIADLQPGVTYHFRVVATNKWGTANGLDTTFEFLPPECPNSHVRQQTGASYLPDCRAYELVSPENAGDTAIPPTESELYWFTGGSEGWSLEKRQHALNSGLASQPSRFSFYADGGGLEGAEVANQLGDMYVSTRTDAGWVTKYPGLPVGEYYSGSHPQCSLRMDQCLTYGVIPEDEEGEFAFNLDNVPYVADTTTGENVGRFPSNYATVPDSREFIGTGQASGDFTHYAFTSLNRLFAVGGITEDPGSVYDNNVEDDSIRVASLLPNGNPIPSVPGAASPTPPALGEGDLMDVDYLEVPALSTDGSRILMGARISPRCNIADRGYTPTCRTEKAELKLYMRVDGAVTYEVSKGHAVYLLGMTRDGRKVLFTSGEQLLPADTDSSVDVYRWDEASDGLSLLSQGNGQGNSDTCSADWTSRCDVVALSSCTAASTYKCTYSPKAEEDNPYVRPFTTFRPDIDTNMATESGDILFESPEQLDPEAPGVPNERNLYEFHDGKVKYLTTFDAGSETNRFNITPDGDHVAFLTDSRLTGYDNNAGPEVKCNKSTHAQSLVMNPTAGTLDIPCQEMYSFDANTGDLICVSCNPTGAAPAGDVFAGSGGPFMSDDGRPFFTTADGLVPRDTNRLYDVYEFVDGRPQLITTGTGAADLFPGFAPVPAFGWFHPPSYVGLEAVSADGVDVYFSTFETLVPQDRNGHFVKMYDARTNGGIPFTPPDLPCPAADECHGPGTPAPPEPQIGTGASLGGGGSAKVAKKKGQNRRRHRKHRKRRGANQPAKHRAGGNHG